MWENSNQGKNESENFSNESSCKNLELELVRKITAWSAGLPP